jgi:ribonuclease VapC
VIVIDTAALIAIILRELMAAACAGALSSEPVALISAGTLAEALIVANSRGIANELAAFVEGLNLDVVPVTRATAQRVSAAHAQWGKGFHPAGLNFGDCFAYATAKERGCPLLYVGNDFGRTDIASALPA